jgi:hypothetical protein
LDDPQFYLNRELSELEFFRKAVSKLLAEARDRYQDDLLPKLAQAGIRILGYGDPVGQTKGLRP